MVGGNIPGPPPHNQAQIRYPGAVKYPAEFEKAMSRALLLAHKCGESDDVPVGAVVVDPSGRIVGEGWNRREADNDPTAHAEILALRDAGGRLGTWNLSSCSLLVTLEPCTMCAGAVVASRVDQLIFGAWDPKAGACGSVRDVVRDSRLNHQVEVIAGVMEAEAAVQLRAFFADKRRKQDKPDSAFWQQPRPAYKPLAERQAEASLRRARFDEAAQRIVSPEIMQALQASSGLAPVSTPKSVPPFSQRTRSERHKDRVEVPPLKLQF